MDELFPRYGIESGGVIDFDAVFGRAAPVVMDIGFGNGEALAALAAAHPDRNYLGVEVYRSGVGRLLRLVEAERLDNVRVTVTDGVLLLRDHVPEASLAGLQLFFPDPWPKKRHHKRRMVQPDWLELVASRLVPRGFLHLATDWHDYADHMLAAVTACSAFINTAGSGEFAADRGERPETKFERRGRSKGHGVWDVIATRAEPA